MSSVTLQFILDSKCVCPLLLEACSSGTDFLCIFQVPWTVDCTEFKKCKLGLENKR